MKTSTTDSLSPIAPPSLGWSVRLLAAIAGLGMASTGECDWLFILVFLSFFLLGIKIEKLSRLRNGIEKVQPVLAALVFVVAVVDFFFLSNSFLLSVAHFLLCLQGLQLLVLRTVRENLGGIMISSLMILSASTLAVEWTFLVMLGLFLPTLVWTLMLHTIFNDSQTLSSSLRDASRLRFEERSLIWGRMKPVLRRSSGLAFLVAIGCCAFVFVTFPRFNFRGFRGQFLQPVQRTGFTNQVDLDKRGEIYTDDSVVMRVEIDEKDTDKWNGYLRGRTLEMFDGRTWKKAPYDTDRLYHTGRGEIRIPMMAESTGVRLHQSIYLESMDSPLLFAAAYPAFLKIDRPVVEVTADGAIQRVRGDSWRMHYEVDSYLPLYPSDLIGKKISRTPYSRRRPNEKSAQSRVRNTNMEFAFSATLPETELSRLQRLAKEIVQNANSDLEASNRLVAHMEKNYLYTLDLEPAKKGRNPVESFVFETKKGHCEYFASALCLMLRYVGIPARVVTGFYSKEWNDRGRYYVIRMKHAHAWVEAFIKPIGWVSFDPSPRGDVGSPRGSEFMRKFEQTWDYFNLRWNRYILSYDFERQKSIIEAVTQRSGRVSLRVENALGISGKMILKLKSMKRSDWISALRSLRKRVEIKRVSSVAVLVGLIIYALLLRRKKQESQKVWFYRPLLRYLEKHAGPKPAHQTLKEYLNTVGERLGGGKEDIEFLENRYYALRFNPSAGLSPHDQTAIRSALHRLK